MIPLLGAILLAGSLALGLSSWVAITPVAVLAFALLIGLIKGRYVATAVALAVAIVLALVSEAATGTVNPGAVPFEDAWIVVLILLAGLVPALVAAGGEATEGSPWSRAGRARSATPLREAAASFIWVFAVVLLGVLFDGVGIIGAEIFCAVFAGLLAAMLLFGLGVARAEPSG